MSESESRHEREFSVEDRYEQLRDDVVDLIDAVKLGAFSLAGVFHRLQSIIERDDARRRESAG